ncbi:quinone oxidoreductase family protein [Streptomyces griseorubiginosus]|uniref:quinone oxidoreductase family protein n=1 Tax=Streptomyces griseorubiginosus TaxID=67304 RepID=UPI001AD785F0|nr:quinone oxidoreductase [Streptomyces griseorubiginosus]MBO4252314.1 zinc-binding dehydrogenase [Streptomyces griseorubiginosus]
MRVVMVNEFGGPETLTVVERPEPRPGPADLVVRVEAVGVNFRDVMVRRGAYPGMPAPPLPVGVEGAGLVTEVGSDVTEFAVGDRVAWADVDGSYAETVKIPEASAVRVPAKVSAQQAAAVLAQGLTVHYLVTSVWPIAGGDSALVLSAAGGVGRLLTQALTARGTRVLAVVSSETKATYARSAGAERVLVGYDEIAAAARDFTEGRGVDVVFDSVAGEGFPSSLASVRPRGCVVLYGASNGEPPLLDVRQLGLSGSVFLTRPRLADFVTTRAEMLERSAELFRWLADGVIDLHIGATYALDAAGAAHKALESRATVGKLVLHP